MLPIIMTSSSTQSKYLVGGLAAGCNDYVSKPPRPEELVARLRAQMRLHRLMKVHEEVRAGATGGTRTRCHRGSPSRTRRP